MSPVYLSFSEFTVPVSLFVVLHGPLYVTIPATVSEVAFIAYNHERVKKVYRMLSDFNCLHCFSILFLVVGLSVVFGVYIFQATVIGGQAWGQVFVLSGAAASARRACLLLLSRRNAIFAGSVPADPTHRNVRMDGSLRIHRSLVRVASRRPLWFQCGRFCVRLHIQRHVGVVWDLPLLRVDRVATLRVELKEFVVKRERNVFQ